MKISAVFSLFSIIVIGFASMGCNLQTGRSRYILAERLFNDRKYAAAVQEFQKIIDSEQKSSLAQQALFRMGVAQYLYLGKYTEAAKSFRQFTFLSQDTAMVYQAEKNIGEIYFVKIEDYKSALEQYLRILGNYPDSLDKGFFKMRIARCYYNLLKFEEAVSRYEQIRKEFANTTLAEEALYQIGNTFYTKGDHEKAIDAFEDLLVKYPKSSFAVSAQFGIANCYEEMDHLDEAFALYKKIKDIYPSPKVIEMKMRRVSERKSNRNR